MANPAAPMGDPTSDVAARIAALEAQITQLEQDAQQLDSQGDPTSAAFMAQKALPKLYSEWRLLLTTQRTLGTPTKPNTTSRYVPTDNPVLGPPSPGSPEIPPGYEVNPGYNPETQVFQDPMTGAQWIVDKNTGEKIRQLSGSIPGWVPGRGVPAPGADQSVGWANLAWSKDRAAQEDAMKRETAAAAYKQFVEEQARTDARNRLTNTTQFTNNLLDTWVKAAPMAATPGQLSGASPWYLGFEPGGPMAQSVRMGGGTYDPNLYKAPIVNIDPQTALEWARNAAAGGK